ncbi:DUF6744 family protein [Saccharothrix obliqua]|uniref:DUF6744 family protein n=1 Tax=Saccharothrix obliqua TaxID=2861747 RepID=UPI001C5E4A8A|nr:DUF6744 family protein [Saccharothrix obliqua]MBW4722446.1 hypothetical protein [Saccharothrix obliqua]
MGQPGTDLQTGDAGFDAYTAALESGETPLLGHLVLYSVFDGKVSHNNLKTWFAELGLDEDFLPGELRPIDAFEKVTGPDGVRLTYALDDPAADWRTIQRRNMLSTKATLMIRHVRRDGEKIVRHVVREVRDEEQTQLDYDPHMADLVFLRDNERDEAGAGDLRIVPDQTSITALPEGEQLRVRELLGEVENLYRHRCAFMTGDKLRTVVRNYIEHLNPIRVRPTGGVYFVHRQHADTLGALRALVSRFGAKSSLTRVPLPDQEEMREMVISAFTSRASDDLNKLAHEIAEAQATGANSTVIQKLYGRFQDLQAATAEHSSLLSTSLDDTDAALTLVKAQLGGLLASGGEDDEED